MKGFAWYRIQPYLRTPQRRAYTLATLTLLAIGLFGAFAIRPALTTITALRKEVGDLTAIDEQLSQKIGTLAKAQTEYRLVKQELYRVDSALPEHDEVSLYLQKLQHVSSATGMTLRGLTLGPPYQSGPLVQFRGNLSLIGTYPQFESFLDTLQRSTLRPTIHDVIVQPQGSGISGTVGISMTITLSGYRSVQE